MEQISLNNDWRYHDTFEEQMVKRDYDEKNMESVRLPHTNVLLPYHYFEDKRYQFVSCYRKHLFAEKCWQEKEVLLTFEAVGHVARVYLNGKEIATHIGGYTAFTVNLAPHLSYGEDNVIAVLVDSRESNNLPPFGNLIDYLTYGGIYREVSLEIKEKTYISDAYIMTHESKVDEETIAEKEEQAKEVKLWVSLNRGEKQTGYLLLCTILDEAGTVIHSGLHKIDQDFLEWDFKVDGVKNWEINRPVLYWLKLELVRETDGTMMDTRRIRFGFRTCEFKKDGFYLNGKKIKLVGLNRHQSFPYVGYAMPKRQQQRDAEILKQELKVNAVRTSHYPQSRHFLDRCDELGLLVFTEIPGWQHIGDFKWKDIAVEEVREMLLQYRNHPSIILWGVRINESQDDDEFYRRTNQLAHELDPNRQTGGVRYLQKSSLLEDVYTYNDFLHQGNNPGLSPKSQVTSNISAPYLVTEFNGHMFPTKAFDDEAHRLQHALRHANVLEALLGQEEIAGAIGWCMADYNTHRDFGSGDRICYHGVLDMFRNPKLAAAVYASQQDEGTVFELSSTLDIGDHPAGNIREIYAFTNADSIRVYKNDALIKEFFPSGGRYQKLPHPPILVNDVIGDLLEKEEHYDHRTAELMKQILFAVKEHGANHLPLGIKLKMTWLMLVKHLKPEEGTRLYYKYIGGWGGQATTFRFEAIKKNQVVKTITKAPAEQPRIEISVDAQELTEGDTYDVAAIRIRAVDAYGNLLPYYQEPLTLRTSGAVALIGPEIISMKGGMAGAYVRTTGASGEGELSIHQSELGEHFIKFRVS